MKKIKAVIFCASAMSSGLIVDSLNNVSKDEGIELDVECYASLKYRHYDYTSLDIILLAPQVKYEENTIRKFAKDKGLDIPIYLIPMRLYGLAKGKEILEDIVKIVNDKRQ